MATLIGIVLAASVAYAVHQDAVSRAWGDGSAILMAIGVFGFLIIFLPIYLLMKNKPGRSKVALAASEAIAKQVDQGVQSIILDPNRIAKKAGISNVVLARRMLVHCQSKGEISSRATIL